VGLFLVLTFLEGCSSIPETTSEFNPFDDAEDQAQTQAQTASPPSTDDDGKRKLIVVSTANGLNQYGKDIQQTLYDVVKQHLNSSLPFTLLTVKPGSVSNPFSSWSNFREERAIWQKISNIRFGFSLDALESLKRVTEEYQQPFEKVLYLTDNGNMDEIDPLALTVPQSWQSANIEFTVLTSGLCIPWNQKAYATQCTELRGRDDLEKVLGNFLGR